MRPCHYQMLSLVCAPYKSTIASRNAQPSSGYAKETGNTLLVQPRKTLVEPLWRELATYVGPGRIHHPVCDSCFIISVPRVPGVPGVPGKGLPLYVP